MSCVVVCIALGVDDVLRGSLPTLIYPGGQGYIESPIRIGIELAAVQRKLPNCVVVGLQLYSARIFRVTLSPRIYKGGQGPPPNNQSTPKAIQTTQDVGYYTNSWPESV